MIIKRKTNIKEESKIWEGRVDNFLEQNLHFFSGVVLFLHLGFSSLFLDINNLIL